MAPEGLLPMDRNQIKEFITRVEDDTAQFVGSEFCAARVIAFISRQHALGEVSDEDAAQLLNDVQHLANLAKLGHRYARWVRNPPAELEIMVIADYEREQKREKV